MSKRRASLETGDVTAELVKYRRRLTPRWEASDDRTRVEYRGIGNGMWAKQESKDSC